MGRPPLNRAIHRGAAFAGALVLATACGVSLIAFAADAEVGRSIGSAWVRVGDGEPTPAQLPPCTLSGTNCQSAAGSAQNSTRAAGVRVAENFQLPSTSVVSQLCWRGVYGNTTCEPADMDDFQVVYYALRGQVAGNIVGGPFRQSDGTLIVQRGLTGAIVAGRQEYQYTATHAGVSFPALSCHWVEITNAGTATCSWFWRHGTGADQRSLYDTGLVYTNSDLQSLDLSLCLNQPLAALSQSSCISGDPQGDTCTDAIPLACGDVLLLSTAQATTAQTDPHFSCRTGGPAIGSGTLWFSFIATGGSAVFETCGSAAPDTLVALYSGVCGAWTEVACSDNAPDCTPGAARISVSGLNSGERYLLQVASRDAASRGPVEVRVSCGECDGMLLGDANADGTINNFDIDAFVQALVDPVGYAQVYGESARVCRNDANRDGLVNNFDIDAFIACILVLPEPGMACP
ncbi:MAG: hypothetical protein IPM64_15095 [Phycisphaerales bacterium]|nr:hypothetical protein [Phycisphaerales bacterium]